MENVKLMEFDTPNKNGRIYPKDVVENAIKEYMSHNTDGRIMGELGTRMEFGLSLNNTSHYFSNIHSDDHFLYGDMTVLNTPCGQILDEVLNQDSPVTLYCAPKGTAEMDENKVVEYHLTSIDIVEDGAFKNCKING